MPNLNHLKIASAPGAFAEWAQKHNDLVRLLEGIEAATGIDIKVVSNPPKRLAVPGTPVAGTKQPSGRIIIGMRSSQFPAGYGPGFGGATNVGNGTANVVGPDGYLIPVVANGNVSAIYPNSLHTNTSNVFCDMNNYGFSASATNMTAVYGPNSVSINYSGYLFQIDVTNGFKAKIISNGSYVSMAPNVFQIYNAGNGASLTVGLADLKHTMGVKTISVCDNGNTKSLDIIASDTY